MFESLAAPTAGREARPAPPTATATGLRSRERDRRREELEEQIAKEQADINAANARLASLVEEHSRHEDWRVHEGVRSESGFLSWRVGLTPAAASAVAEVAERLRDLPRIGAAFRAGRLSLDQVRAVVQVATPEDEPELLRLALGMSGAQLARFCAYYRHILRIERGRHRARFLRTSYTSDGMWHASARLAAEEGAVVDKALAAAIEALRREEDEPAVDGDDDADDPYAAERADALVRLADTASSFDVDRRDERHVVVIHADASVLASEEGEATIEGGGAIPAEAAARIACEAPSVALLERNGRPLAVGRKTRRVGRTLRRSLEARDRQCQFPGCHRRGRLQAHHMRHWARGGETSPENLLLLCRSHHIATHEHGLRVERSFDGFLFRRPDRSVIRRPRLQARGPGIVYRNGLNGIEVTPETCAPGWGGERGSIRYVTDVFVARSRPSRPPP